MTAAAAADFSRRAWLGAAAFAFLARLGAIDLDGFGNARRRLFQVQRNIATYIVAAPLSTTASPTAPEKIAKQTTAQNVPEGFKNIFDVREVRAGTIHPRVTILVVASAFCIVAQDLVRFGRLLKLPRGIFVTRMAIGVKLQRQAAVSRRDFLFRGGTFNAQDLVVVRFFSHR
jgi:hypothetical protein